MELDIQSLQRQNAVKAISGILQGKFKNALQSLSTSDGLVDKIIDSFDF
jgi:hypothetical protein